MESRRLTMKNPGGRNYRLACAVDTADLRVDMGREYPTLLGNKIDVIGKLEDLHPLEWYLENVKK
ncbi:unknown [Firmicutes bacterium CAG:646]|nr:unknown [Firmicutes bacterium CAG:646]